jgi:acyl-CoA thioesterase-2
MTAQLFDLNATHNPHRWYLPVIDELCVGPPDRRFLFGGVALAAAISALEQTCERPVIWATAQYMSFARPGSIVDLDVWVPVEGNQTSQAYVIEHIEDRKIITVNAALGSRQSDICDQWLSIPDVPRPRSCTEVHGWRRPVEGILRRFETRLAQGRFATGEQITGRGEDGRVRFWIRSREGLSTDRKLLAVVADYVSVAISNAIGRLAGGNSLDNTIRYARVEDCEWILCDVQIETVCNGVVHGAMRLFSESGTLMASASQSLILRCHDLENKRQRPGDK